MKDNLEPEYLVDLIWHWKVEDNLDWKFCSGILLQDNDITISPTTLKNKFNKYFKDLTGVIPYTKCPKCGNQTIPKKGKYGRFISCSEYPDCRYVAVPNNEEAKNEVAKTLIEFGRDLLTECPKCKGSLVVRDSVKGKFIGCSSYPDCDFIVRPKRTRRTSEQIKKDKEELKNKLLEETGYAPYTPCPSCGKELVPREGRFGAFVGCSGYPECNFLASSEKKKNEAIQELKETTGYEPDMDCPKCGSKLKLCRGSSGYFIGCSNYPACSFIPEPLEIIKSRSNFAELTLINTENVQKIVDELNKFALRFDGVSIKQRGRIDYIAEIEGFKTNKNVFTYWILWDSVKFQIGNDSGSLVYLKHLQELESCNYFQLIENKYNELISIHRRKKQ